MTNRERFMATLKGESADRIPVFPLLLFFAANRAGITYREYATNGKAMAEAQLRVQEQFDLDAITACSDAFRISADLGGDMVYPETNPPYLSTPLITSSSDLQKLGQPDPTDKQSRMGDRVLAVIRNGESCFDPSCHTGMGGYAIRRGMFCVRSLAIHAADAR